MPDIQQINVGSAPNDGTGDSLRVAGQKMNANANALADATRDKADQSALDSLATTVAAKANTSALNALADVVDGKLDPEDLFPAAGSLSAGTDTWAWSLAESRKTLELTANTVITIGALAVEASGLVRVVQDGTGGRTLAFTPPQGLSVVYQGGGGTVPVSPAPDAGTFVGFERVGDVIYVWSDYRPEVQAGGLEGIGLTTVHRLTQAEYDGLAPDADTLYIITE